jgi:2-hydroxychromene-2-carboxylate isomerase|tara:strand:- start:4018 stop:4620 length:603 start_codon:yes stop_codon:yes gene_type:complete
MIVDFIYDVATPNGYLTHKVVPEFEERTGTNFNYVPCLAGGIFKLTNNVPPLIATADIKNKADYFFIEISRFVKKHNLSKFKNNSFFPQNSLNIQRGAIAAKELGVLKEYVECTMSAMWEKDLNIQDLEVLKKALDEDGIDHKTILEMIQTKECKDKLIANTSWAVEKGAFGIPTFLIDDQIFFGKDHMDQLEDYINSIK